MLNTPKFWPESGELLEWIGEVNLSRNENSVVIAVSAKEVLNDYVQWYDSHREASVKIADLMGLEHRLCKAEEETAVWKQCCDHLFAISKQTAKLQAGTLSKNLIVQKIKPHKPKRFDGSQDLEVVTQFLEDVQHYVQQGRVVCQKASEDNQKIDTFWRFLTAKVFQWLENCMKKQGLDTIPPKDYNYNTTWDAVKVLFKHQYVQEQAISVFRREWYTLKFSRQQVLSFNQRALEMITILGGPLSITRENPLWEEYLIKLPEATQNDISQQACLLDILSGDSQKQMTLSGMMHIVAAITLPFLPMPSRSGVLALSPNVIRAQGDPMDLSNIENEELNTVIDGRIQCHRCLGFGHITCLYGTPITDNCTAQFKPRRERKGGREGLHKQHQPSY